MPAVTRQTVQDGEWRSAWRVAGDPAPGVALAVPIACMEAKDSPGPRNWSWMAHGFTAAERTFSVTWVGHAPGEGLVAATGGWDAGRGRAMAPRQGWSDFRGHALTLRKEGYAFVTSPNLGDIISSWPLPWPKETYGRDLSALRAGKLTHSLVEEFVRKLPPGTWDAYAATASFREDVGFRLLDRLLGRDPAPGVDVPTAGLRRRQFFVAAPLVAASPPGQSPAVLAAVDRGERVLPLLAQELAAPLPVVRALAGLRETDRMRFPMARTFLDVRASGPLLEGMDPSWLPLLQDLDGRGWEGMASLARASSVAASRQDDGRWGDGRSLSRVGQALARHVGATLSPEPGRGLGWVADHVRIWEHFPDLARAMTQELIAPALARTAPSFEPQSTHRQFCHTALLSMGARRAARCCHLHLGGAVHDARALAASAPSSDRGWGEAAPPVTAPNGRVLRFLRDRAQLAEEGRRLDHCVASYWDRCTDRSSAIMSVGIRSGGGRTEPSSTVEFRARPDGGPRVRQHLGSRNGKPPEADAKAVEWWLKQVEDGKIALRPGSLAYRPGSAGDGYARIEDRLGQDWRTPDAHARRWDRWRRLLGTRATSFGDWLLSLPPVLLEADPCHGVILGRVLDMDIEMGIAAEIEALDAAQVIPDGPARRR
jgi:hypothetical protein